MVESAAGCSGANRMTGRRGISAAGIGDEGPRCMKGIEDLMGSFDDGDEVEWRGGREGLSIVRLTSSSDPISIASSTFSISASESSIANFSEISERIHSASGGWIGVGVSTMTSSSAVAMSSFCSTSCRAFSVSSVTLGGGCGGVYGLPVEGFPICPAVSRICFYLNEA